MEDQHAYASVLFTKEGHWRIGLDELAIPYPSLIKHGWPSIFESTIYSLSGDWALAVSDEDFAIAAGSPAFLENLRLGMPEFSDGAMEGFIADWQSRQERQPNNPRIRQSLIEILEHLYGQAAARWLRLFDTSPGT